MSPGVWTKIIALCLFFFLLVTTIKFQWTFANKPIDDRTSNEKRNTTTRIHIDGKYRKYISFLIISQQFSCIGGSRSGARDATPSLWAKISSFSCSFRKNWPNGRLVPPIGVGVPLENPRFTTELFVSEFLPKWYIRW